MPRGLEPPRAVSRARPAGPAPLCVALWTGASLLVPHASDAQQRPTPAAVAGQAAPAPLGVSPGGAFLRALLVPGWGHVAIGSYTRGGFYFAVETATAYTLLRTRWHLSEARERLALRESVLRASLAEQGITDPGEVEARLGEDERLQSFQDLVESRQNHQEDLVAFGIFLLFLTGADAYVSAHLARFPAPIELQASPSAVGGAELGVRVTLPK